MSKSENEAPNINPKLTFVKRAPSGQSQPSLDSRVCGRPTIFIKIVVFFVIQALILSPISASAGTSVSANSVIATPAEKAWKIGEIRQLFVLFASTNSVLLLDKNLSVQAPSGLASKIFISGDRLVMVHSDDMPPAFAITLAGINRESGLKVSEEIAVRVLVDFVAREFQPLGVVAEESKFAHYEAKPTDEIDFNDKVRTVHDVDFTAITARMEPGSDLWKFTKREDVRSLTIRTRKLVAKGDANFPGASLTIIADEFEWIDPPGGAPSKIEITPLSRSPQTDPKLAGKDGIASGVFKLQVKKFVNPGTTARFISRGGQGGSPSPASGTRGLDGPDYPGLSIGAHTPYNVKSQCPYPVIHAIRVNRVNAKKENPSPQYRVGPPDAPHGQDAKPGPPVGRGGHGGKIQSLNDIPASMFDVGVGASGESVITPGGRAGNQSSGNMFYGAYVDNNPFIGGGESWVHCDFATRCISGKDAASPDPASKPEAGRFEKINEIPVFLSVMQLELDRATKLFMANYFSSAKTLLESILRDAAATTNANNLSEQGRIDLSSVSARADTLLRRLNSGLAYDGNVRSSVPLYTAHAAKSVIEKKARRFGNLRWIELRLESVQVSTDGRRKDLIAAADEGRAKVRETAEDVNLALASQARLASAAEVAARTRQQVVLAYQQSLSAVNAPPAQVQSKLDTRTVLRMVGNALSVVPQPFVSAFGTTLSAVSTIQTGTDAIDAGRELLSSGVLGHFTKAEFMTAVNQGNELLKKLRDLPSLSDPNQMKEYAKLVENTIDPVWKAYKFARNQEANLNAPLAAISTQLSGVALQNQLHLLSSQADDLAHGEADFRDQAERQSALAEDSSRRLKRALLAYAKIEAALATDLDQPSFIEAANAIHELRMEAEQELIDLLIDFQRAYWHRSFDPVGVDTTLVSLVDSSLKALNRDRENALTPSEVETVVGLYQKNVETAVSQTVKYYRDNRPAPSGPVLFHLSPAAIEQLNRGRTRISLAEILPGSYENTRVSRLSVANIKFRNGETLPSHLDIRAIHQGTATIRKAGINWVFSYYNSNTEQRIEWTSRWDKGTGKIANLETSNELADWIESGFGTEARKVFVSPGAVAEIDLVVQPSEGKAPVIESLEIVAEIEFINAARQVLITSDIPFTTVTLSQPDVAGTKIGVTPFFFTPETGKTYEVKVPQQIGDYSLVGWQEADTIVTNSSAITIVPGANRKLRVRYEVPGSGLPPGLPEIVAGPDESIASPSSITASQAATGYQSPGTLTVTGQFVYPSTNQVLSLRYQPILPKNWKVAAVAGDGDPELQQGEIVFIGTLKANPINFSYSVSIPAGETGPKDIFGVVEFQFNGMSNPKTIRARPDPLSTDAIRFHTADFREPYGVIDATELNRCLAYWRSQGYHCDASGLDGFAPGAGLLTCGRHSADYREPFGIIDGTEINRVLAVWRAACYRADTTGFDGFAPGCSDTGVRKSVRLSHPDEVAAFCKARSLYKAGETLSISARVKYSSTLWSLLLRPELPNGWRINSVSGPGNPELQSGEIVWTGIIPPSPIELTYTVQIPSGEAGVKELRAMVEAQLGGAKNPTSLSAMPNRLLIGDGQSGFCQLLIADEPGMNGARFELRAEPDARFDIQSSRDLLTWHTLAAGVTSGFTFPIGADTSDKDCQFYRAVSTK